MEELLNVGTKVKSLVDSDFSLENGETIFVPKNSILEVIGHDMWGTTKLKNKDDIEFNAYITTKNLDPESNFLVKII